MTQNYHLDAGERMALKVSKVLEDYIIDYMGLPSAETPSPIDAFSVASGFIADLLHFACLHGADVPDVLSRAFQNYLEEISSGDAPEETIDRFRTLIEDSIYEATVGPFCDDRLQWSMIIGVAPREALLEEEVVPQCQNPPPCGICHVCRNENPLAEKRRAEIANELQQLRQDDESN